MAKKREYEWFLEPCCDVAYTNNILSKNIEEENALQDVPCQDGKIRNLWRCPSGMLFMIWRSRGNFGKEFKVKIFCREKNGKARNVTFLFKNENKGKKRKRKTKAPSGKF